MYVVFRSRLANDTMTNRRLLPICEKNFLFARCDVDLEAFVRSSSFLNVDYSRRTVSREFVQHWRNFEDLADVISSIFA